MSVISRFKKILTWTIMSTTVIALTAIPTALGSEATDFGFKIVKQKEDKIARQLTCLARNVFYEARGESMQGQMAVAQVTVNRARSGIFPIDLCAVVSQTTAIAGGDRVCQFSWYCDNQLSKTRVISPTDPAYIAAKRVFIEGHRIASISKDVYFFRRHDVAMQSNWPNTTVAQIGNHVFYKRER